jgi:S1-C subfamily serine protease
MKQFVNLLAVFAVFVSVACASYTPAPPAPADDYVSLFKKYSKSIVRIERETDEYERGLSGTGFVYDKDTIVTAKHVVEEQKVFDLTYEKGLKFFILINGKEYKIKKIWLSSDKENDTAAIDVEGIITAPAIALNKTASPVGTKLFTIGYPLDLAMSFSTGYIDSIPNEPFTLNTGPGMTQTYRGVISANLTTEPGSSGGPLIDFKGRVLGIVLGGPRYTMYTWATSANSIRKALNEFGMK